MNGSGRFCFWTAARMRSGARTSVMGPALPHTNRVTCTRVSGRTIKCTGRDVSQRASHSYEGHFVNGKRHGKGILRWPNGMVYRGDFGTREMHGMGNIQNKMGNKYVGEFRTGRIEGAGALYTPAGNRIAR